MKKCNEMLIVYVLTIICYVFGITLLVKSEIGLGIIWIILGTGILLYGIYDNKNSKKKSNNKKNRCKVE